MNNDIKEKPTPDNTIEIDVNKLKTLKIKLNKIFKEKDDWFIEYYDIKEILDYLKDFIEEDKLEQINLNRWFISSLLDYITNLQEKSNNQAEEINRLYKQREKFMKKYGYLKEENERLINRNIYYINNEKNLLSDWHQEHNEAIEYKSRNEKAIEYIELGLANEEEAEELLNILGGDEEC